VRLAVSRLVLLADARPAGFHADHFSHPLISRFVVSQYVGFVGLSI